MLVVAVLVAVNYFLFFHDSAPERSVTADERSRAVDPATVPANHLDGGPNSDAPELRGGPDERDDFGEPVGRRVTGSLKRGQTVLNALRAEGIGGSSALPLAHAMGKVFDFRKAQVGDTFEADVNDEGQVTRLTYEQSPLDVFVVRLQDDGTYRAKQKKVPTRIDIAHIGCAIRSSLYESITRCGEGGRLAGRLIDLFAWDLDFFQDSRDGDELKVIVEKISVDGRFLKYGAVMAAEYKGKFGTHRIVNYRDPNGDAAFFTPDGRGVKKDFLKSPLKYTRVSAKGVSGIRTSLKKASPVIYTATAKTPVWAVSGGTVVFAGESGSLGRTVTIRHANGYTSTYGHLGRIAQGITTGTLVKQKTLLGRVGKSGTASKPQLLFSLRKDGRLVNPLNVRFTESDPVADEHRPHFDHEVRGLLEDLEATPVVGVRERRG